MHQTIISVHVPKTAGNSFGRWLDQTFAPARVRRDYGDRPIDPSSEMNRDPEGFLLRYGQATELPEGIAVVHGHFWARKYEKVANGVRVAFLREPVARTISHYFFWMNTAPDGHSLHQMVREHGLDLLRFARLPQISGLYTDYFFRQVDMRSFAFIGDSGKYETELARLAEMLGKRGDITVWANRNSEPRYRQLQSEVQADTSIHAGLIDALARDIAFYERWTGQ